MSTIKKRRQIWFSWFSVLFTIHLTPQKEEFGQELWLTLEIPVTQGTQDAKKEFYCKWVPGQPGQHSKMVSLKKKKKNPETTLLRR